MNSVFISGEVNRIGTILTRYNSYKFMIIHIWVKSVTKHNEYYNMKVVVRGDLTNRIRMYLRKKDKIDIRGHLEEHDEKIELVADRISVNCSKYIDGPLD